MGERGSKREGKVNSCMIYELYSSQVAGSRKTRKRQLTT